jgi:uncharacterized protein YkvS
MANRGFNKMKLSIEQKHRIADRFYASIKDASIEELLVFNQVIVERIKHLQKAAALNKMAQFRIGDIVSFNHGDHLITGRIVKFNQKTVSIITDNDRRWNVPPVLLMKKV